MALWTNSPLPCHTGAVRQGASQPGHLSVPANRQTTCRSAFSLPQKNCLRPASARFGPLQPTTRPNAQPLPLASAQLATDDPQRTNRLKTLVNSLNFAYSRLSSPIHKQFIRSNLYFFIQRLEPIPTLQHSKTPSPQAAVTPSHTQSHPVTPKKSKSNQIK